MSDYSTRNIIDYAQDQDGVEFRKELYGAIHDRVAAHLEAAKVAVARRMMNIEEPEDDEEVQEDSDEQNTGE
jgi:hypothetical protein